MTDTIQGWNAIYKGNYGRRYPFEPLIVYVQRLKARGFQGKRALDIGFGTIADLLMLHEVGYEIYGVEVAQNALIKAQESFDKLGICCQLDLWTPGSPFHYDDNLFDLIVAIACLHYNLDQDGVIREIARVIRPGGRLITTYPAPGFHYWKFTNIIRPGVRCYTEDYPNKDTVGVEFISFESEHEIVSLYEQYFCEVEVSRYHYRLLGQDTSFWLVTGCRK